MQQSAYPTRQPVTTANVMAHEAAVRERIVAARAGKADIPVAARILCRNVKEQLVQYLLEHPQCLREDMLVYGFTDREIDRWLPEARPEAARRWHGLAA